MVENQWQSNYSIIEGGQRQYLNSSYAIYTILNIIQKLCLFIIQGSA